MHGTATMGLSQGGINSEVDGGLLFLNASGPAVAALDWSDLIGPLNQGPFHMMEYDDQEGLLQIDVPGVLSSFSM